MDINENQKNRGFDNNLLKKDLQTPKKETKKCLLGQKRMRPKSLLSKGVKELEQIKKKANKYIPNYSVSSKNDFQSFSLGTRIIEESIFENDVICLSRAFRDKLFINNGDVYKELSLIKRKIYELSKTLSKDINCNIPEFGGENCYDKEKAEDILKKIKSEYKSKFEVKYKEKTNQYNDLLFEEIRQKFNNKFIGDEDLTNSDVFRFKMQHGYYASIDCCIEDLKILFENLKKNIKGNSNNPPLLPDSSSRFSDLYLHFLTLTFKKFVIDIKSVKSVFHPPREDEADDSQASTAESGRLGGLLGEKHKKKGKGKELSLPFPKSPLSYDGLLERDLEFMIFSNNLPHSKLDPSFLPIEKKFETLDDYRHLRPGDTEHFLETRLRPAGCTGECCKDITQLGPFSLENSRWDGECGCRVNKIECAPGICGCKEGECKNMSLYSKKFLKFNEDVEKRLAWGIDLFIYRNLLYILPENFDFDSECLRNYIEKGLIVALNKLDKNGNKLSNACKYIMEHKNIFGETYAYLSRHLYNYLTKSAICGKTLDKAYSKGMGIFCIKKDGIKANQLIAPYFGEVYPLYLWFEKQDLIKNRGLDKNLPDFYNITIERMRGDPDGFDLAMIDSNRAGNFASRMSHSCKPNCGTVLMASGNKYCIGMFAVKDIKYDEELTFDYNSTTEREEEFKSSICLCSSYNCRGHFLILQNSQIFTEILDKFHTFAQRTAILLRVCEEKDRGITREEMKLFKKYSIGRSLMFGTPLWLRRWVYYTLYYIDIEKKLIPIILYNAASKENNNDNISNEKKIEGIIKDFKKNIEFNKKDMNIFIKSIKETEARLIHNAENSYSERRKLDIYNFDSDYVWEKKRYQSKTRTRSESLINNNINNENNINNSLCDNNKNNNIYNNDVSKNGNNIETQNNKENNENNINDNNKKDISYLRIQSLSKQAKELFNKISKLPLKCNNKSIYTTPIHNNNTILNDINDKCNISLESDNKTKFILRFENEESNIENKSIKQDDKNNENLIDKCKENNENLMEKNNYEKNCKENIIENCNCNKEKDNKNTSNNNIYLMENENDDCSIDNDEELDDFCKNWDIENVNENNKNDMNIEKEDKNSENNVNLDDNQDNISNNSNDKNNINNSKINPSTDSKIYTNDNSKDQNNIISSLETILKNQKFMKEQNLLLPEKYNKVLFDSFKCQGIMISEQRIESLIITINKIKHLLSTIEEKHRNEPPLYILNEEENLTDNYLPFLSNLKDNLNNIYKFNYKDMPNVIVEKIKSIVNLIRDKMFNICNSNPLSEAKKFNEEIREFLLQLSEEFLKIEKISKEYEYKKIVDFYGLSDIVFLTAKTKLFFKANKIIGAPYKGENIKVLKRDVDSSCLTKEYSKFIDSDWDTVILEGRKEYEKNYIWGQLVNWYIQTMEKPNINVSGYKKGILYYPNIESFFYGKNNNFDDINNENDVDNNLDSNKESNNIQGNNIENIMDNDNVFNSTIENKKEQKEKNNDIYENTYMINNTVKNNNIIIKNISNSKNQKDENNNCNIDNNYNNDMLSNSLYDNKKEEQYLSNYNYNYNYYQYNFFPNDYYRLNIKCNNLKDNHTINNNNKDGKINNNNINDNKSYSIYHQNLSTITASNIAYNENTINIDNDRKLNNNIYTSNNFNNNYSIISDTSANTIVHTNINNNSNTNKIIQTSLNKNIENFNIQTKPNESNISTKINQTKEYKINNDNYKTPINNFSTFSFSISYNYPSIHFNSPQSLHPLPLNKNNSNAHPCPEQELASSSSASAQQPQKVPKSPKSSKSQNSQNSSNVNDRKNFFQNLSREPLAPWAGRRWKFSGKCVFGSVVFDRVFERVYDVEYVRKCVGEVYKEIIGETK